MILCFLSPIIFLDFFALLKVFVTQNATYTHAYHGSITPIIVLWIIRMWSFSIMAYLTSNCI